MEFITRIWRNKDIWISFKMITRNPVVIYGIKKAIEISVNRQEKELEPIKKAIIEYEKTTSSSK